MMQKPTRRIKALYFAPALERSGWFDWQAKRADRLARKWRGEMDGRGSFDIELGPTGDAALLAYDAGTRVSSDDVKAASALWFKAHTRRRFSGKNR